MNGGDILFDALNGVSDRYVLEAGDLLRIGEEKPHGRGKAKLWKTALLAAALALLLAAAVYAAGLLHWKDQTYSIEGTNRVIVVPNGLRGTKRTKAPPHGGRGPRHSGRSGRNPTGASHKGTTLCAKPARHTGRRRRRPRQSCGRSRRPTVLSFIPRASL